MPPPPAMPASSPPRVHRRLLAAPDGPVPVLHTGPHAAYVDVGGRCVGVVAAGAAGTARVPCALRVSARGLPDVGSAAVVGGVLHLAGVPVVVGRLHSVSVPRVSAQLLGKAPVPRETRSLSAQLRDHERDHEPPVDAETVARLVGAGEGLTPYGDDVLCGWLAVHRATGIATPDVDAAVRAHLPRTTLLSATLLDCALNGEVLPELAAYLSAPDPTARRVAERALTAVGHSSGVGLLAGARRALSEIRVATGAAA